MFKSQVWLDPEKSWRKRDSNLGPSALEADALPLGQRCSPNRWQCVHETHKEAEHTWQFLGLERSVGDGAFAERSVRGGGDTHRPCVPHCPHRQAVCAQHCLCHLHTAPPSLLHLSCHLTLHHYPQYTCTVTCTQRHHPYYTCLVTLHCIIILNTPVLLPAHSAIILTTPVLSPYTASLSSIHLYCYLHTAHITVITTPVLSPYTASLSSIHLYCYLHTAPSSLLHLSCHLTLHHYPQYTCTVTCTQRHHPYYTCLVTLHGMIILNTPVLLPAHTTTIITTPVVTLNSIIILNTPVLFTQYHHPYYTYLVTLHGMIILNTPVLLHSIMALSTPILSPDSLHHDPQYICTVTSTNH